MSRLRSATIESRGTVGWFVNHCEPHRPFSSPICQMKISDRFGLTGPFANASAISRIDTEPEPSSSAPLLIESRRAG